MTECDSICQLEGNLLECQIECHREDCNIYNYILYCFFWVPSFGRAKFRGIKQIHTR